jgi:mRNA interferase RelE/StbE
VGSFKVFIKPSAVKEIEAIDGKKDRERVVSRIRDLANDPRPPGCEKLSGQEKYRVRQGDHRIVYAVEDKKSVVTVVKVGHRREIYRQVRQTRTP